MASPFGSVIHSALGIDAMIQVGITIGVDDVNFLEFGVLRELGDQRAVKQEEDSKPREKDPPRR